MLTAFLAALFVLVIAMAGAWAVQRATGNSGWIDTIWSFAVGDAALLALALMPGDGARRLLLALLVGLWAARLGLHILLRTRKISDDPRYQALMAGWGDAAGRRLFSFLQVQALAGAVLVGAVMLAAATPAPVLAPATLALAALGVLAIAGEALADAQLAACKRQRPPSGICDSGLWGRSRHPNYFFEWLFWCAVAGLALVPPFGALSLLALGAPAMMYALLRYGSGVPHLEAHMRRTRPDAFAAYAARVPVFFPRLW